jgi:hypothetical protein
MYRPIAYATNETRIFLTFHIFEPGTGSTELNMLPITATMSRYLEYSPVVTIHITLIKWVL